jgi:Leucine-rich repeat (LRR) protein
MRTLESLTLINTTLAFLDPAWFNYTTNLVKLNINSNLLGGLDSNSFSKLPLLQLLDLGLNIIESIQPGIFSGLKQLLYLRLDGNKIKILESYVMAGLVNLVDPSPFRLSNQNIEEIRPFALTGLRKISSLILTSNSLTSLMKNSFYGLANLSFLDLSNNKINSIEVETFIGLLALKVLNISSNLLNSTLHRAFLNLTSLETLFLNENQITVVFDDSFEGLGRSLLKLNLAKNKLNFIKNESFRDLSKLVLLDLASNSISSIQTGSFQNQRFLKVLILSDNCIYKINPLLFKNQGLLNELHLDYNSLTKIETVFRNLNNLTVLNLAFNSIYQLTNQTFTGLNSLVYLNLSNNFLKSLNRSLFSLKSVRSFDLTNNMLRTGHTEQFYFDQKYSTYEFYFRNSSLEIIKQMRESNILKLDLSFNNLSKDGLMNNINFKEMSQNLIYLDLRRTRLDGYAVDFLNILKKLTYIDLSDNFIRFKGKFLPFTANLTAIKLSNVNLSNAVFETYIDLGFFELLTFLDLSLNNLESVKYKYFNFSIRFNFLNLSHNKIKFIEDKAIPNRFMKVFDLSFNNLSIITMSSFYANLFYQCKFLVTNNKIERFIVDLAFIEMHVVNLSGNGLKEVPDNLQAQTLDMSFNAIRTIKQNTFSQILVNLFLSCNQIESIEDNSFLKLTRLVDLDLSNNRLTNLGNDTFCGLFSLKFLNINNNSILFISKGLFRQLINLEHLLLDSNPIKLVEAESFSKLSFLKFLCLDSFNPSDEKRITNLTFDGLNNLRKLVLEKHILDILSNLLSIQSNLKPQYDSTILGIVYYKSRNVIFSEEDYTDWDCFLVLFSVRFQVQVNLFQETTLKFFLDYCGKYSLTQLRFIINSIIIS